MVELRNSLRKQFSVAFLHVAFLHFAMAELGPGRSRAESVALRTAFGHLQTIPRLNDKISAFASDLSFGPVVDRPSQVAPATDELARP